MSKPNKADILQLTRSWIDRMVIGLNLCPFAKHPFENKQVRLSVIRSNNMAEWIKAIFNEAHLIKDTDPAELSNSLLVFSNGLDEFEAFLELVDMAQITIEDQRLSNVIQLASFHPKYQFAGSNKEDSSNFTNRSPYPMIHFLRVDEVATAIDKHKDTTQIPEVNLELLNDMGSEKIKEILGKDLNQIISD